MSPRKNENPALAKTHIPFQGFLGSDAISKLETAAPKHENLVTASQAQAKKTRGLASLRPFVCLLLFVVMHFSKARSRPSKPVPPVLAENCMGSRENCRKSRRLCLKRCAFVGLIIWLKARELRETKQQNKHAEKWGIIFSIMH